MALQKLASFGKLPAYKKLVVVILFVTALALITSALGMTMVSLGLNWSLPFLWVLVAAALLWPTKAAPTRKN